MLTGAIDQPIDNLAVFLWTYTVQTSTEEDQMINIIRYVLTDFCGKCNRPEEFHSKSERTFWIDRVIPIFQTIGDQTGLLGFEWCETNPISFTESTINKDTWKSGPLRNVDGLGYNKTKTDIIVMEASSGQNNEDMVHTKDDTLKNIHGSICALESSLRRYQYARCTTATDLLVFSVQSVCTRITLSTTSMDPNNPGRYLHEECRSAEIPMRYSERLKWLKVFELVSKLVILLRKQTLVVNQLEKENSGIISVDMVDTVWHIMNTNISEEVLTKN
ncbi:hypothetical protein CLU79DRAFT_804594 [Phycomyces nitens]|nr:hypothetical protein CLU79DRAFT_804594 [Phycomyces nitens]